MQAGKWEGKDLACGLWIGSGYLKPDFFHGGHYRRFGLTSQSVGFIRLGRNKGVEAREWHACRVSVAS